MLLFFEKFNPDETNKKVSLGTRGPDNRIYVSLRQAEVRIKGKEIGN
jgi:hypothetical protein